MKKRDQFMSLFTSLFVIDPGVTNLVHHYMSRIKVHTCKMLVVLFLIATKVHTLDHNETNQWWMDTFNQHVDDDDMFHTLQEFNQYERLLLQMLEWKLLDQAVFCNVEREI